MGRAAPRAKYALPAVLAAVATFVSLPYGSTARAQQKEACIAAYEQAQLLKRDGKLRGAREKLRICAAAECGNLIRRDCVEWLGDVDRSIPTVVFEAKVDDASIFDVKVSVDGDVLATQLDGKAIAIDPGMHVFRFEREGAPPLEQKAVIPEGQKHRIVSAQWRSPVPPAPPQGPPAPRAPEPRAEPYTLSRPVPSPTWVFGGVAAGGLVLFGAFAIGGSVRRADLESGCAPFCSESNVRGARTWFVLADVSLVVGLTALAASLVTYLTRPTVVVPPVGAVVAASR